MITNEVIRVSDDGKHVPTAADIQALAAFIKACEPYDETIDNKVWVTVGKVVQAYCERFVGAA